MKHSIDSISFSNSWTINDVTIVYTSNNLRLVLSSFNLDIVKAAPGYNIYVLIVPIVSDNVLISASGTLTQQTTRIL